MRQFLKFPKNATELGQNGQQRWKQKWFKSFDVQGQ